jgi:hypothetical protein
MPSDLLRFSSRPTNSGSYALRLTGAEDCRLVSGHDFSRAVYAAKSNWALAPEGRFSERSDCR